MFDVSSILDRRREHWILATMLLVLHVALQVRIGSALAASLMMVHLGFFFLWQPIWQRDQRLDLTGTLLILLFTAAVIVALNWWLLFAWHILLIGIVAGRSLSTRKERYAYMLTLAFLVSELLIGVVPQLFDVGPLAPAVVSVFQVGLVALPGLLLLLPVTQTGQRQTFPIEFFRGIIIALITALLAVGSVLMTLQRAADYPTALFISLLAVSALLLFISWLITPTAGSGLGALWEQSVLNIGTPFEAWITRLAALAEAESSADAFLSAAIEELIALPWVVGAAWSAAQMTDLRGVRTPNSTQIQTPLLTVTLFLERPPGPALLLHCHLLMQILGHFYAAKRREQEQAHQAQLKAIYETGARLTHDIKNLLQSLKLMTAAAQAPGGPGQAREEEQLKLLKRQLPHVVQRLQLALDKLQQPAPGGGAQQALYQWWQQLVSRYDNGGIAFTATIDDQDVPVPGECMDSVVENLLDNARGKAAADPLLRISVALASAGGRFTLSVTDSGNRIPAAIAAQLFRQTVASQSGLGVGLYQAHEQALRAALELRLAENRDGCVRFELSGAGGSG